MKYHLTIWTILPFLSLIINAVLPSAAKATKVTTSIIEEYSNGKNGQDIRTLKKAKTFSSAEIEEKCFTKKDKEGKYWVVKDDNHDALVDATEKLISPKGVWQGASNCPTYVKYRGSLNKDDFTYIEKWLTFKKLKYFVICEWEKGANLETVMDWYENLLEQKADIQSKDIYKLMWLDWSNAFRYTGDEIPYEWIENHRTYYRQSGLYED